MFLARFLLLEGGENFSLIISDISCLYSLTSSQKGTESNAANIKNISNVNNVNSFFMNNFRILSYILFFYITNNILIIFIQASI